MRDVEYKIGKGGLRARAGRIGALAGVCALLSACARPQLADSFICQPSSPATPPAPSIAYSGRTIADLRIAAG